MKHFEPDVDERIVTAREEAQKVLSGHVDNVDEFMLVLRKVIAEKRGMGFFDDYFKKRTLDELVFEVELLTGKPRDNVDYGSKLLTENRKEAESLFADWDAIDSAPRPPPPPPSSAAPAPAPDAPIAAEDTQFWKDAVAFMETGEFKQEEEKK